MPDMVQLIRAAFPGTRITAWVPADLYDQVGRNPVVTALKAAKLPPNRAENAVMCRGSLSPSLRTERNGRRLLRVDTSATETLRAFAAGYNFPVRPSGERATEPEKGASRTLMEALECLTVAIAKADTPEQLFRPNATNSLGTPYMSALPR